MTYRSGLKGYIKTVAIGFDQFINTLFGGDEDETLSSRMGKNIDTCKTCQFVCWLLHLIDTNHCQKSIEYDEGKYDRLVNRE